MLRGDVSDERKDLNGWYVHIRRVLVAPLRKLNHGPPLLFL